MGLVQPTKYNKQPHINVIDSIMGSGKSSWAIQHMNNAPARQKFIYITPFKAEIDRIISECNNREFVQPLDDGKETKFNDIKKLIAKGVDIASSHSLFQRIDDEMLELLEIEDYTLILDEEMEVIKPLKEYDVSDLMLLYHEGIIKVDGNGFVQWTKDYYTSEKGRFARIRNLAKAGNLMMYDDEAGEPVALYWAFPIDSFKCFNEVYLLTYLFHGQVQRAYFDLFNVNYKCYSVENIDGHYQIVDYIPHYEENRQHLKQNINIYYPASTDKKDMNKVGDKRTDFSVGNIRYRKDKTEIKKVIRNNAYNFYRNKCKASPEKVMWTTYKDYISDYEPRGLKNVKDNFVSVSCRATNEYQHKTTCIYLANRFLNPMTVNFFAKHGVQVDEDLFALSELLQWLFRSRIRNNKPIDLYIPSKRMRTLLENYLDNKT